MLKQHKKEFENIEALLCYLEKTKAKSKTAILGGHFLLDYEINSNSLKPMIISDAPNKYFEETTKVEAGNFPEESLDYSLEILEKFSPEIDINIFLLVNDHKFPTVWAKGAREKIPDLRRKYYRNPKAIPSSYIDKISSKGLKPSNVLLENKNEKRKADEVLPKSTFLFSEYIYRKQFDRTLKNKILELDNFYSIENNGGKREIFFKTDDIEDHCIVQEGDCGCSGEIMQVIYDMVTNYDMKNLILFIPNSCASAVSGGIKSILYFLEKALKIKDIKISMIVGLKGDPDKLFIKQLTLVEYGG